MMDQHEDPKFDQWLKDAARTTYHAPPTTPRDEMWARIEAGRRHKHIIELRPWMGWAVAAAAVLVLGIGIGRWTANQSTDGTRVATNGSTPSAVPGSTQVTREIDSLAGVAYRIAATQYLSRTEAFLTSFRTDVNRSANTARLARQARELLSTDRAFVIVDANQAHIDAFRERHPDTIFLHGDAAEDVMLQDAGVARAAGVFAVVGDDSRNLVITLSAKSLNPKVRVVARCHDIAWVDKMKRVGADAIVSPDFTGGMRIAAAMIRPAVVTFLDEMLRSDKALRVEEVRVAERHAGQTLGMIDRRGPDHIVLAVRAGAQWTFNPAPDFPLNGGELVVVVATPQGRKSLEERFA